MKKLLTIILLLLVPFIYGQNISKDTIDIKTYEIVGVRADNNTPITKTNLKEKEINTLYNYYEELPLFLNKTPNITSSTDGGHNLGYVYFRLRGIDQTRINMTLNGIPLNELEDQGVYFSNYPDFLSTVKSMQIQRGVGTSSYGTSSYGGSINFVSKDGNKRNTLIDIGGGSFNTMKFSIENSTGLINNKISFYTRFSKFSTDGYKYNSGNDGMSFFLNGGYYGNKDVIKIIAFNGKVKNGMSWFGESYENIMIDPRTNSNTEREIDEFNQSLISIIYNREINKKLFINVNGFYNKLKGYWLYDNFDYDIFEPI
jgi:iron complex outermembrane receptor protein